MQSQRAEVNTVHDGHSVVMRGIKKSYGGIHALHGVDLRVRMGSVHALVGENGAGKSTLLKILQGVVAPSSGEVTVLGRDMTTFSPDAARSLGVGMIFQELSLVPTLSVAQNVFLNREPRRFGFTDDGAAAAQSRALLHDLGVDVDPTSIVADLSIGQAQMTEIAKAISQNARVLILDEPTSALNTEEVSRLFAFLRRMTSQGVSVIYVSHRMDEIMEIADEVTILRDGRNVVSAPIAELTLDKVIESMIGKRVTNFNHRERLVDRSIRPLLEVRNLSGGSSKPRNVSFNLYRGEVLGVAGLMGAGRTELARTLFGIDRIVSGEVIMNGVPLRINSPVDAIRAGIALIPESRQFEGLHINESVGRNISLPQIDRMVRGMSLDRRREAELAERMIRALRVKTESSGTIVKSLSGGNQQKVAIAKWLALEPELLIFDEPTAGVDIGSKSEIIELMRSLADTGKAIIVMSSEPAELLAASDRILIFSRGRLAREVGRAEIDSWSERNETTESGVSARMEHGLQVAIQGAQ